MESATMLHLPTCVETRRRSFVFLEVLDVDVTGGELSGDGGVAMVEEEAGAGVQGGDLIHLRGRSSRPSGLDGSWTRRWLGPSPV